jgi:hypothetical protein
MLYFEILSGFWRVNPAYIIAIMNLEVLIATLRMYQNRRSLESEITMLSRLALCLRVVIGRDIMLRD